MAKNRQVQHRPDREVVRGKELTAAKQEVKQLKRSVSRLQKTIQKMEDQRGIQIPIEEASPEAPVPVKNDPCGHGAQVSFQVPGGGSLLSICKVCHVKRRTRSL